MSRQKAGGLENARADLVDEEADHVGQDVHVAEHEERPVPAAGFAADDRQRAHALHGQDEPDQQADGDQRRPDGLAGDGAVAGGVGVGAHGVGECRLSSSPAA